MNFLEVLKGAIKNLKGNKIRSFLTMLGIIIGISSVITMSSIGKGGQENITGNLKKGGYGKFAVSVDKSEESFRWKYLFDKNVIEKLKDTKEFGNISPDITARMRIKIGKMNAFSYLEVTTPDFEIIEPATMVSGRGFLPLDYSSGEKNIVIDNVTARQIYKNEQNAIGKTIDIAKGWKGKEITYNIVGVMKNPIEQMAKVMGGNRFPRFLRMPLNTYEKIYGEKGNGYTDLVVSSKNPENIATDMKNMKIQLEKITGIKELYEVSIKNTGAESFDKILDTLNIFVTFVAGISLFVGGIGVMNIMLVSVIERTKEIGIRKAIGATNKDILLQFLTESIILTGFGGILGIVFGVIFALGIGEVVDIKPIFSIYSIFISLGVSTLIGVMFGVAPARKASKLNPIDALRSD
ncbi:ABC transporter permease [uncultured Cetobacterium sp.]|uniref:ABC transporter permease n=1 Tax=uncultured Cetobacterium sp. TaxID=527638 RepID=UPI0026077941|nr:ABC transporter permease [uncultured Cetobacterium sp.]